MALHEEFRVKASYAREADAYAEFIKTSFSWRSIEAPAFDRYAARFCDVTHHVLDIGCGTGRVAQFMIDHGALSSHVMGVDGSEEMLAHARYVQTICQDIRFLDLPSKNFSLAVSNMVFQTLDADDLRATLLGVNAHLAEDGVLFFVVTHPLRQCQGDMRKYSQTGWINIKTSWKTPQQNFHRTIQCYVEALNNTGFVVTQLLELMPLRMYKETEPDQYEEYTKFGPARLAIKARKF